jgi:signal transduction histidine kinase
MGLDSTLQRVIEVLPAIIATAVVVWLILALLSWAANAFSGQNNRRVTEFANTVMSQTVLRRDRRETLGTILSVCVQELGAVSGAVLLSPHGSDNFELVSAEGVTRLDLLVHVSAQDGLVVKALQQTSDALVTRISSGSRWNALSDGRRYWLAALFLKGPDMNGLLVLAWPGRAAAHRSTRALMQISVYVGQVLADFANLERNARQIQQINDDYYVQELMVRTLAHDLGNALMLPRNYLAMLDGLIPSELETDRKTSEHSLNMMGEMINDLLERDRPLEPVPVPVEEVVSLATAMMATNHSPGGIEFHANVPPGLPDLYGERMAILRIVDNLLRNAVRHNGDCPALRIWLSARQVDHMIEFEVGDTGGGIPLEVQPNLFEFGFRVDSSGKVKGYGLGLYSCRRLVTLHRGQIWVESSPEQGTRFFFTLPIARGME